MASIEKTQHGTYRARWRTPQGKTRSRTFKSREEAKAALRGVESDLHTGRYVDPKGGKTKLADWIDQWHTARLNLRPSTQARDDSYIRNLILPYLGSTQLRHLSPVVIRGWVRTIHDTHAPATVHKAHQLLKAALQAAVADQLILANPATGTPLPRLEKPEHRYLGIDEVHDLADAIDPRYRALIYTGALAGLRPGELAALRIDDLDLLRRTLRVERTATEIAGHLDYGPPKTAAARRTITMPNLLAGIFAEHLAAHPSPTPYVFTSSTGKPMRWTNLRRRAWRQAVLASVGEPMTPHDMRHTHAALSIAEGAHPKVLQARLGHSSIKVTMDVYGGLFAGYDEAVADALDEAFSTPRVSDPRQKSIGNVVELPSA